MSSSITPEASKILRRWAGSDYYVYLRPISSKYHEPHKKERTYWAVQVECRVIVHTEDGRPTNLTPFRGEGYDLSEIIVGLGLQVPRRSKGYVLEKPTSFSGWLVPQAEMKRQRMVMRQKTEDAAPKKKRKKKKVKRD